MPGWTITGNGWAGAVDWARSSIFNQFAAAYTERLLAVDSEYSWNTPQRRVFDRELGDDGQWTRYFWWLWTVHQEPLIQENVGLQGNLERICDNFVNSHDHPGNWDGDAWGDDGPPLYTLATWRTAIGLLGDGFRRVPGGSWPADWTDYADAAYEHGFVQEGDIIGPWLFKDLQDGLNLLVWTRLRPSWDGMHRRGQEQLGANWAAAKAAAETDYDNGDPAGFYQLRAATWGSKQMLGENVNYRATMQRSYGKLKLSIPNFAKSMVDFYAQPELPYFAGENPATRPNDVFDDNGDGFDEYHGLMKLLQTVHNDDGSGEPDGGLPHIDIETGNFGDTNLNKPAWTDAPIAWDVNRYRGYESVDYLEDPQTHIRYNVAVLRWNITDGFEYY